MNNENIDLYEEICEFLEDNISKLAKLKVASRDKYKEMDQLLMNYFTAESIDDEDRMELFSEQLDECFVWLRHKERKAIVNNSELLGSKLVRDYMRVLGEPIIDEQ